jgi:peptidoglycan hydrolase-like protein with peptidoglycan-binding domain
VLEESWTGEAHVLWRDHEALPPLLALGQRGAPVAWLQLSLGSLGFYRGAATGQYEDRTFDAVQAFQASRRLEPDGTVGPLTKMALYEALGRYPIPHLKRGENNE